VLELDARYDEQLFEITGMSETIVLLSEIKTNEEFLEFELNVAWDRDPPGRDELDGSPY
jgi:hypothetical protein